MFEDEWRNNVTITSDHKKYYDVDEVSGFHQYVYESIPRLTSKIFEISLLELLAWIPSSTASHFQISGGKTDSSLLHGRLKIKKTKQSTCRKLTIQYDDDLLITLSLYIYIYIIIIKLCWLHRVLWVSLTICPYHPLL